MWGRVAVVGCTDRVLNQVVAFKPWNDVKVCVEYHLPCICTGVGDYVDSLTEMARGKQDGGRTEAGVV